jgi:hypothetical protein
MFLRLIVIIITAPILFSCTFKPWETIQYKNLETETIVHRFDNLPDKVQYEDNYLNGAFVDIGAIGENATVYSSREPYAIFIYLIGKSGEHINFSIDNMEILSSSGNDYSNSILDIPVIVDFETINLIPQNNNYVRGRYSTDYIFNFYDDEIYISFILEVSTEEKKERKEMVFTLTKISKKGLFQSYW